MARMAPHSVLGSCYGCKQSGKDSDRDMVGHTALYRRARRSTGFIRFFEPASHKRFVFSYQRPRAVLCGASLVKAIAITDMAVAGARMAAVQHLLARLLALGH